MTRNILDDAHIHPAIREKIATHHADIVREVRAAIAANDVVVVGMKQNPLRSEPGAADPERHIEEIMAGKSTPT